MVFGPLVHCIKGVKTSFIFKIHLRDKALSYLFLYMLFFFQRVHYPSTIVLEFVLNDDVLIPNVF